MLVSAVVRGWRWELRSHLNGLLNGLNGSWVHPYRFELMVLLLMETNSESDPIMTINLFREARLSSTP